MESRSLSSRHNISRGNSGKNNMMRPAPGGLEDVAQEASFYSACDENYQGFHQEMHRNSSVFIGQCYLQQGLAQRKPGGGRLKEIEVIRFDPVKERNAREHALVDDLYAPCLMRQLLTLIVTVDNSQRWKIALSPWEQFLHRQHNVSKWLLLIFLCFYISHNTITILLPGDLELYPPLGRIYTCC